MTAQTQRGLTEEELALLGHADLLAGDRQEPEPFEECDSLLAGFRERLLLGDLSW